jgi:hypothetical protein
MTLVIQMKNWTWLRWLGLLVCIAIGLILGYGYMLTERAGDSLRITRVADILEQGGIKDPSQQDRAMWLQRAAKALRAVTPGAYKHVSVHSGVTYEAILILGANGSYSYALSIGVGNARRAYTHAGRWWVQGEVLHTLLLTGHDFLTYPAARDRQTPAQAAIEEVSTEHLLLKSHYGSAVRFERIKTS